MLGRLFGKTAVTAAEGLANVVDRFVETPDEKAAMEQVRRRMLMEPGKAQVELNKIEAGHRSVFVAGWRPFIGWVGGLGLAFYYIPQYALGTWLWVEMVRETRVMHPYPVDSDGLLQLVLAMLGMGAMRSLEKLQGKSK